MVQLQTDLVQYYEKEIMRERERDEKEMSKKEQPRKMKRDISRMNGPT